MQETGVVAQLVREYVAGIEREVLNTGMTAGGLDRHPGNGQYWRSDAVHGHEGATAGQVLAGLEVAAADGFAQVSSEAVGRLLEHRDKCRPTHLDNAQMISAEPVVVGVVVADLVSPMPCWPPFMRDNSWADAA